GTERDCALTAVFSGFPNVLTVHGNMKSLAEFFHAPVGSFHWLAARLETFALKRAGGVFCNSIYTEKLVSPRARKTWRVPNALRREFFEPGLEIKKSPRPVLLNVGSVLPYKQQRELLEVARGLHRRGFKLELQFAGECVAQADYGAAFRRELAAAEQDGYARYLGVL